MEPIRPVPTDADSIDVFSPAFALLLEAADLAADLAVDPWDFAVELGVLRKAGVTNSSLRWMVAKGYLQHAREQTVSTTAARTFQPSINLAFSKRTCFVLTESGLLVARQRALVQLPTLFQAPSPELPIWDADRQELRVGPIIVKRFRVPAPNQEIVLATFQEEGWPVRIDDPLSPVPGLDCKRRLHETVTSLNRNQKQPLLRFHGDGSGEGVLWERTG